MTTTEPTTEIVCTKSQFRTALAHEFAVAMVDTTEANMAEVRQAIADLAQRADNTRGVFSGYDDYLDLAYTVAPDASPLAPAAGSGSARCTEHGPLCPHPTRCAERPHQWRTCGHRADFTSEAEHDRDCPAALEIPAVTDEQRAQSREAADATLRQAIRTLNGAAAMLREHANDPQLIDAIARDVWELSNVLQAAAGHLRIAQQ